jgi:hypothetical protein
MTQRSVSQAEHDAEAARARLEQTLAEVRASLSPGRLFDETLAYARNSGGADFAKNLGRQVRDNPLPIALVGAGLAWLMLARRNGANDSGDIESRFRTARDRFGDGASATGGSGFGEGASELAGQAGEALGSARARATATIDAVSETASQASRRVSESASDAAHQLRRGMHDARDRAASVSRKVRNGVTTIMEEQPLVLGAVGLAIGAAMAAAFPSTRIEDRIAGPHSDQVKKELKDAASDAADRAANVAGRAFDSAYREGERAAVDEGLLPASDRAEDAEEKRRDSQQAMATQTGA